jgi:hypothetical protein
MKTQALIAGSGMALLAAGIILTIQSAEKAHLQTSISPRKLADSLHAVIAADRAVYLRVIVQRLALEERALPTGQEWEKNKCLPGHAQMLRLAAVTIQQQGAEFSYTLRSLWPIDPNQGPQTEVERIGLEQVAKNPGTNFYSAEQLGGRSYFTAIYPDRAVLPSCVECHNQHPASPKRDFRLQDVMGAIVVRIPLEF